MSSNQPQFCPECGSGIVSQDDSGMTVRVPRGFPFDAPCKTCRKASDERFGRLGATAAEEIERRVINKLTGASTE